MERVVACQARPNYQVWVRFTDGVEGVVDLSEMVGRGVFAAWSDVAFFNRVSVDPVTRTLSWPGGIDLDLDVLYSNLTGKALPGSEAAA